MIKDILAPYPKLELSILPTSIYKLNKLSDYLGGNIYCMRDDLTGFALGGNKTRKLDYLIADALNKGCDTLVAVGANQSNFCRIAAAYGKVHNMNVHLVLAGKKPQKATGNVLLDHLYGAVVHHMDTEDQEALMKKADKLCQELMNKGKNIYFLPLGGSTATGVLGYLEAFHEILTFSNTHQISFSKILHASGSGGTQAGLVLGKSITSWPGEIMGISVMQAANELYETIHDLCHETVKKYRLNARSYEIKVSDGFIGEKYGAKTKEASEAIKLFARLEGIILDEVYTGKAASGLIHHVRNNEANQNENILFIHTGGFVQLFE